MPHFKATTAHGTVYDLDGRYLRVLKEGRLVASYNVWTFKSFSMENETIQGWPDIHALPEAKSPVLGERMVLIGRDEWRISMEVIKIEEVYEKETGN